MSMMHVMASFFGYATTVIPRLYTYYISSLLFAVFGLKMLHEGYHMSPNEGQEEFEEVGEELRKKEEQEKKGGLESGGTKGTDASAFSFLSKIFVQSFTMTMLAEWGDRSQLATVILGTWYTCFLLNYSVVILFFLDILNVQKGLKLATSDLLLLPAAREDVYGVCVGGILGHALCTGLAVVGGRIIATRISVRTVTLVRRVINLPLISPFRVSDWRRGLHPVRPERPRDDARVGRERWRDLVVNIL